MMNRLIAFALTQRMLMLLLAIILAGAGWRAFQQLPIDAFPDVSPTQVKLIIKAPGMTPEEVETRILAPLEAELLGVPEQSMMRSVAKYAIADLTLDFNEGTDIYWARQQVSERLAGIWPDLPDSISGGVAPITTPLGEMFMFTVDNPKLSLTERRHLLDWVIRPRLRALSGVADVNALGGYVRSIEVIPDAARLAARGFTLTTLVDALESNNRNDGAGRINTGDEAILVRAEGRLRGVEDVSRIVVGTVRGVPVHVGDVAEVRIGALTRYGAVTSSGQGEVVQGLVLGLRGANARDVVGRVAAELEDIEKSLPEGTQLNVFYNRASLVSKAVGTVSKALAEAVVLVVLLLIAFLGQLRAAVAVAMSLPLAALITFILMQQVGMSANLMSLGGLAIAIGMLVDGAVVVVENIVQQLGATNAQRHPPLHLIYRAVREVAVPVTSGILIIMIVFLPLLSLTGLEGKLFKPVALTITFALGGSLVMSLTVIPVLASLLLKAEPHGEPWLVRRLHAMYSPALAYAFQRPKVIYAAAGATLVVGVLAYSQVGKSFMPTMDEGDLIVQLESLPSINLPASAAQALEVQNQLVREIPEIVRTVARTGSDELGMDPMGLNESDMFLVLKPREEWTVPDKDSLIDAIRQVLIKRPGFNFGFTQPIEMRVSEMLTGVRGDVAIKIFGSDLEQLNRLAGEVASVVSKIPGAEDVLASENDGMQYRNYQFDRQALGRLGLDVDQVETWLKAQVEGINAGTIQEGVARTPLLLRGQAWDSSEADLDATYLQLPDGQPVPLTSVIRPQREEGVVSVAREQGSRFTVVRANVSGRDLVGFVDDAKAAVAQKVRMPTGYHLQWGGQFENQQRASRRLMMVVPIALGLIFLMLFTTFGSVRQASLVLANIPFALVGGIAALWLTGAYLSVPASVGLIALLGIAVLNGVVLVTYFNQLRSEGVLLLDAVRAGAERRLRPVLMTASIAALGLVPLLFATGPGSEIQKPLAIVVIGGLVTSTLLTLILFPLLYLHFERRAEDQT